MNKQERRFFTIHGREYLLTKLQTKKEFGCKTEEDVEKIWKDGEQVVREDQKPTEKPVEKTVVETVSPKLEQVTTEGQQVKATPEDQALTIISLMKTLRENGITKVTSRLLKDKLGLDAEHGRGQIRRLMRKLEAEGKVVIGERKKGMLKQYVYSLKEP